MTGAAPVARILIGGDICPIEGNAPYFERGDAEALFHDLLPEFASADLVVANLECPLVDRPSAIAKTGPVFGARPACINGIRAAGVDVLGLANNHILDHGPDGLTSTLAACAAAGIDTVGAGPDLGAARRMLVRTLGGLRVGLLGMAEHEFSIATPESPGANPLDVIDFVRTVTECADRIDYLIVLFHGGAEFMTTPSPRLRETCRFLVEMGADAVVVQHPHALAGYEHYRGGHIVYGQGALVMDEAIYRGSRSFHEGVVVSLDVEGRRRSSMRLLPFVQSVPVPGARRMGGDAAVRFLADLDERARRVSDDGHLKREWTRHCEARKHEYMSALLAHGRFLRRANRRGWLSRVLYRQRRLLATRNAVTCETHRDAVETIFREGLI